MTRARPCDPTSPLGAHIAAAAKARTARHGRLGLGGGGELGWDRSSREEAATLKAEALVCLPMLRIEIITSVFDSNCLLNCCTICSSSCTSGICIFNVVSTRRHAHARISSAHHTNAVLSNYVALLFLLLCCCVPVLCAPSPFLRTRTHALVLVAEFVEPRDNYVGVLRDRRRLQLGQRMQCPAAH